MIKISNLCVSYKKKFVIHNLNMNIEKNDCWLFFGPNGAGKTTILKTIFGLHKEYSGLISIEDKNIADFSIKEISKKMGYLPQEEYFSFPLRVMDVLLFGRYPYHSFFSKFSSEDKDIVFETASKFGLDGLLFKNIQSLSSGERKKVLIASSFLQNVLIFLFDEPLNFLDPKAINSFLDMIQIFLKEGRTIIVASHFIEYFFPVVNKMLAINHGNVVYCGKKIFDKDIFKCTYEINYESDKNRFSFF